MSRAPKFVGTDAEATQVQLVESWMDSHSGWWTVQEIREGIVDEGGPRIERVQGRLDALQKRRHLSDRIRVGTCKEYRLGAVRTEPRCKAFGLEATAWLGEGVAVWMHRSDVENPALAAEVEALRILVSDYVTTRIVPLISPTSAEDWFTFLAEP
jgi:hypothetical protein